MERRRIDFLFKGDRQYIHGTDMFNATVGMHRAPLLRKIHFTIHGMVRNPSCELYESDSSEELVNLQGVKMRANYQLAGASRWIALSESASTHPGSRYDYPENRIPSLCDVEKAS